MWSPDVLGTNTKAVRGHWTKVKPFALASADQFRSPPPPALGSPDYLASFDEVKRFGGDDVTTPSERTEDQTVIGGYLGHDGVAKLGTPPRLL